MPSVLDSVKPIGVEVAAGNASGQTYQTPTEMNPHQDAVSVAGVHLQDTSATSSDKAVWIDRQAGSLRLSDSITQRMLSELVTSVSGQVNSHDNQRDFAHFLDGIGPSSGAGYLVRTMSGPLVASETWYTSSSMATKIIAKTYAYPAGSPLPSSCLYTLYSASGIALKTCSEAFTYSGPFVASTTRTFANVS